MPPGVRVQVPPLAHASYYAPRTSCVGAPAHPCPRLLRRRSPAGFGAASCASICWRHPTATRPGSRRSVSTPHACRPASGSPRAPSRDGPASCPLAQPDPRPTGRRPGPADGRRVRAGAAGYSLPGGAGWGLGRIFAGSEEDFGWIRAQKPPQISLRIGGSDRKAGEPEWGDLEHRLVVVLAGRWLAGAQSLWVAGGSTDGGGAWEHRRRRCVGAPTEEVRGASYRQRESR